MAINLITEKPVSSTLESDACILITQTEDVGGTDEVALRRITKANFRSGISVPTITDSGLGIIITLE